MKVRTYLAVAGALALALPAAAGAAPAAFKVTGGGQITPTDSEGAGDTIAFQAQAPSATSDAARGQLQYKNRGAESFKGHGTVDCLVVSRGDTTDENTENDFDRAVIGGYWDKDPSRRFRVYLIDHGQPVGEDGSGDPESPAGSDLITVEQVSADDERGRCEPGDTSFDELPALGRGNVKIHRDKTREANRRSRRSGAKRVVSLAGLR